MFGDGVMQDTQYHVGNRKNELIGKHKDQWQADMMNAVGNEIHLYDRMYIPKEVMDNWLNFYGIEESSPESIFLILRHLTSNSQSYAVNGLWSKPAEITITRTT